MGLSIQGHTGLQRATQGSTGSQGSLGTLGIHGFLGYLLDFGDLGEAWHAIWSGHRRSALTKWHGILPPDPQNPKCCNSYVIHYVLWMFHFV